VNRLPKFELGTYPSATLATPATPEPESSKSSESSTGGPARTKEERQGVHPSSIPPDYRTLYRQMAEAIPEDFPLIDSWLADHHPGVWQRLRQVDGEIATLEQGGIDEETYQQKLEELLSLCRAAKSLREGSWGAVLINSQVLGGELVWVVRDEEEARAVMSDGRAVYLADEIELLKGKSPEEIRDVHKAKLVFPRSRVVQ